MGKGSTRDDTIRAMHVAGCPVSDIAEVTGITSGGVYAAMKRLGLSKSQREKTDAQRELFEPMCERGLTVGAMVDETGLSDASIRRILAKLGLKAAPVYDPDRRLRDDNTIPNHPRIAETSRDKRIEAMARAGKSHADIARAVGISEIRACAALGRLGLHGTRVYAEMTWGQKA